MYEPNTSNKIRCGWRGVTHQDYIRYHDEEWGVPIRHDDGKQFEFLILEGAQAGLSCFRYQECRRLAQKPAG